MDACFLCLENNKTIDYIQVNSDKWNEQNMQKLIEKHLWPMETINSLSWICMCCGKELYDFHKFYNRIEEAHKNLDMFLKNEDEFPFRDEKYFNNNYGNQSEEDCKDNVFDRIELGENIIVEQAVANECILDEPIIKSENVEDFGTEDMEIRKSRKRGRPKKGAPTKGEEDPLTKKSKQSRSTKVKVRKRKEKELKDLNYTFVPKQNLVKKSVLESDPGDQKTIAENINNDSETDTESQKNEDNSNESQVVKKKNHRNLNEKTLKEYDRIIAENFKIYCNICELPMDNFLSLRKHFKVEHKERGYVRCCKRNFFTRSLLVDHIHVHLNPDHFKCQQCGKVFSERSRLQGHRKLHEDLSNLDKCEKCGKLFTDKSALKKHILTHSSEKPFPCEICGKYFTNSFILNHHIEAVHQNKFVQICDVCGKSIRCRIAFAGHIKKHDINSTPISCDVCGLILSNKEGLKCHKNSQHPEGGKKDHTCHICLKVSPTARALKAHIRSVHEQGFDYKCSFCEKSFKRPAALKEHIATHTGTPLYTCLWCPRTFISNANMYNHRKNAHQKEWEELKRQKYIENMA